MRQRAGWKSLPRPARSASNPEVRQGSCEWRQPFVGCREASSSLVARSKKNTPSDRMGYSFWNVPQHRRTRCLDLREARQIKRWGRAPANGDSHSWDAGKRVRASSPAPKTPPYRVVFFSCAPRRSPSCQPSDGGCRRRQPGHFLESASLHPPQAALRRFPRRPLQKEYPIRQDGVFFLECAAAPENSLPRPARSASNQEVRQGSCEWRQPFVGCRVASSSLVAGV